MELIYLLRKIKDKKTLVIFVTLITTILGVSYYFIQDTQYNASLLFYVKRQVEESSDKYYNYDGYYASQVSKEYSDTVVGFFKTIDVLKRAGEITSYIDVQPDELEKLSKKIIIEKEAPQLVRVSITLIDKERAREVVKAVGQSGIERMKLLNQLGDPHLSVDVVDPEPVILSKLYSVYLLAGVGFVIGLVVSILLVVFLDIQSKIKEKS